MTTLYISSVGSGRLQRFGRITAWWTEMYLSTASLSFNTLHPGVGVPLFSVAS
jgi:hypothetical protein